MKYRFREQYDAVLQKKQSLRAAAAFSAADEPGSKVSILVPFMEELVEEQELDSRESFEMQTERLVDYYESHNRAPQPIMDATPEDFEHVLADESIPTVVVAGFGNFSAIAVPLPRGEDQSFHFGYLDWLHLAGMATHLKLGRFVALQCGGFYREFNPPLASGVQNSNRHILAAVGRGRYATGDWEQETAPIATTDDELSYEQIRDMYPMQRRRFIPDMAHMAMREVRDQMNNERPRPDRIPYPDAMRQFKSPRA